MSWTIASSPRTSTFHELLERLRDEHEREVDLLRAQLQQQDAASADVPSPPRKPPPKLDIDAVEVGAKAIGIAAVPSVESSAGTAVVDSSPGAVNGEEVDKPALPLQALTINAGERPEEQDVPSAASSPKHPSAQMNAIKRATSEKSEPEEPEEGEASQSLPVQQLTKSPSERDEPSTASTGSISGFRLGGIDGKMITSTAAGKQKAISPTPSTASTAGNTPTAASFRTSLAIPASPGNSVAARTRGGRSSFMEGHTSTDNVFSSEKDDLGIEQQDTVRKGSVLCYTTESFGVSSTVSSRSKSSSRVSIGGQPGLELHPIWDALAQEYDEHGPEAPAATLLTRKSTLNMKRLMTSRYGTFFRFCDISPLIASPSSRSRLIWDLCGVFFLCYDLFTVPLQVFELKDDVLADVARYLTAAFWACDFVASFFVGYHKMGMVEMNPGKVALHYLRSWFLLDLTLVSTDWVILCVAGTSTSSSALRFGKVARGMRALRLLRLMKFNLLLADLTTRVRSEYTRTMLNILKIILFIVCVNHFIACGYYGLHHLGSEAGLHTWVEKNFKSNNEGKDIAYRYWTSMHWSLTQFTPASMEVVPTNTFERMYTVCVLLFALVTFSSFVSSITTAMTHLRNINARRLEQDGTLRRYLCEHEISPQLTSRVLHYFQDRNQQNRRQARTKEEDAELFRVLPESLKFECRTEAYRPLITMHPLFHQIDATHAPCIAHICRAAINERRLIVRDELWGHGTDLTHMLFLTEGVLQYKYLINNLTVTDRIQKGEWSCEVALWANSAELYGPFTAESNCELLMIDRSQVRDIVEKYARVAGMVAKYAEYYITDAKEVVKRCRWQTVMLNDFDAAQDLAQKAFEEPGQHANGRGSMDGGQRWSLFSDGQRHQRFSGRGQHGHLHIPGIDYMMNAIQGRHSGHSGEGKRASTEFTKVDSCEVKGEATPVDTTGSAQMAPVASDQFTPAVSTQMVAAASKEETIPDKSRAKRDGKGRRQVILPGEASVSFET